ncbi:MAG TPA: LPS assembly lipoprotein LptE [Flavisolibacter sp.]|nr:LPS assembly lipoprotein LptE [Flavisolibacter sp.]
MLKLNRLVFLIIPLLILFITFSNTGCGVYSFADVSIPDSIKTVRVNFIENRAPYVNPQLSPNLTERIRQKIVNQTRLNQTNNENAHYDITGWVQDYSLSTTGISDKREVTNRLTVSVHIIVNNQLSNTKQEFDISRNFEFSASLSLQQAENQLQDEMIRNLTDDIFNRVFSNW